MEVDYFSDASNSETIDDIFIFRVPPPIESWWLHQCMAHGIIDCMFLYSNEFLPLRKITSFVKEIRADDIG